MGNNDNYLEDPSEAVDPAPRRAAPTKQESLLRALFGLPKPNEETRIVHNDSFKDLHFIGGEEEAHDYWDRKWEAHRRTSLDERERERDAREARHGAAGSSKMKTDLALGGVLPAGKPPSPRGPATPGPLPAARSPRSPSPTPASGSESATVEMLDRTSSRRDPRRVHAVVPCCTDATTTPTDRVARGARSRRLARARSLPPSMDFDITTSRPRARAPGRPGAPASAHRPDAPFGPRDLARGPPPHRPRLQRLPLVDEPTLREFLECCGPLRRLARAPPRDGASRFLATFATQDAARAALALRDVTIIDRTIRIHPGASPSSNRRDDALATLAVAGVDDVRRDADAVVADPSATPAARRGAARRLAAANDAARMDPLELYRAARELLPSYFSEGFRRCALFVPVPHLVLAARRAAEARIAAARDDDVTRSRGEAPDESDVARTVYAGNVNSSITEDMLADFFNRGGGDARQVRGERREPEPIRFRGVCRSRRRRGGEGDGGRATRGDDAQGETQ